MGQGSELPGAAHLALVQGATLLHPETAVFEAMLAGWRTQQQSRLLTAATIRGRDGQVRRFQRFQRLPVEVVARGPREQVYRLVVGTPERLSLRTFSALCDILGCSPDDLFEPIIVEAQAPKRSQAGGDEAARNLRPRPARIRRSET